MTHRLQLLALLIIAALMATGWITLSLTAAEDGLLPVGSVPVYMPNPYPYPAPYPYPYPAAYVPAAFRDWPQPYPAYSATAVVPATFTPPAPMEGE
jgi:hypothetical protein